MAKRRKVRRIYSKITKWISEYCSELWDDIKTKKISFFVYLITLLGMVGMGILFSLFFDPGINLVQRLILYIIGVLPIVIIIRFERNGIAIAVILAAFNIFIFSQYLLSTIFYSYISPYYIIFNRYRDFVALIGKFTLSIQPLIMVAKFSYLIDIIILITITGVMSALWYNINRAISKDSLIQYAYMIVVVILSILLIVLPYATIVSSGVLQFGLAYGSGVVELRLGITESIEMQTLEAGVSNFQDASSQFKDSSQLFEGLNQLKLTNILTLLIPEYKEIFLNINKIINSTILFSQGLVPLVNSVIQMELGIDDATSNEYSRSLLSDLSSRINQSKRYLDQAEPNIDNSIEEFDQVDIKDFSHQTKNQNLGDYSNDLFFLRHGGYLFEHFIDVLILQLSSTPIHRAPFDHLLRAIFSTTILQQQIGETTQFGDTSQYLEGIKSNLTIVDQSFNRSKHNEYSRIEQLNLQNIEILELLRENLLGSIQFMSDFTKLGIQISDFGFILVDILNQINQSISILSSPSYEFPQLPQMQLNTAIHQLELLIPKSESAKNTALKIEKMIQQIKNNASTGTYGLLSGSAYDVTNVLLKFQLLQNANNFYHLVNALYFLLLAVEELQRIDQSIELIDGNITRIENNQNNQTIVGNSLENIDNSILDIRTHINQSREYLQNSTYHVNQIQNMPEADRISNAIFNINQQLEEIIFGEFGLNSLNELINNIDPDNISSDDIDELNDHENEIDIEYNEIDEIVETVNVNA